MAIKAIASTKPFLSRSEVARLFHVSPITVVRWATQGKLPFELTLGGQRRYPTAGTLAIRQELTREAQAQQPQRTRGARARPSRNRSSRKTGGAR